MIHTLVNANYNSRKRKPGQIVAIIVDANRKALDAIDPGEGTHKQAIDWAEWRAETIREQYPEAARLVVYVDDIEIGEVDLPSLRKETRTPLEAGAVCSDRTAKDKVTGYVLGVIGGYRCNARELYGLCNAAREAWDIARALDGGTLDDIRREIVAYLYLTCEDRALHFIGYSRSAVNKEISKIDWLNE